MPILEIAILIKVGNYIGTMNTVLVIILTGILGAVLTRIQGFMIVQKINERLNRGMMPSQEILDGALVFVGGFCLLMPGLIGDLIGIILLIPWTRLLVRMLAAHYPLCISVQNRKNGSSVLNRSTKKSPPRSRK